MRVHGNGNHGHRCLPVLLRVQALPRAASAEAGRLLRLLLVRLRKVPADAATGWLLRARRLSVGMLYAVRFHDRPDRASVRQQQLQAHVDWLAAHRDVILVGGSLRRQRGDNPVGGLWIVEADSKEQLEQLMESDPFWTHGLRERCEILLWSKALPDKVLI